MSDEISGPPSPPIKIFNLKIVRMNKEIKGHFTGGLLVSRNFTTRLEKKFSFLLCLFCFSLFRVFTGTLFYDLNSIVYYTPRIEGDGFSDLSAYGCEPSIAGGSRECKLFCVRDVTQATFTRTSQFLQISGLEKIVFTHLRSARNRFCRPR